MIQIIAQRKDLRPVIVMLTGIAVAGCILVGILSRKNAAFLEGDIYDPAAEAGILSDMPEQEIRDRLDQAVEEGMLDISIASGITFQNWKSGGQADICNAETNRYLVKTAITLEDNGETVYESEKIPPGEMISTIQLNQKLNAGEYPATAVFTAYTQDTRQIVGVTGARIILYVEQ
jgi:hypothetical protein